MLEGVMWAVGMLFAVGIGYALFRFGQILADKKSKGKATAIAIAVTAVFGHIATLPREQFGAPKNSRIALGNRN
tara:strand:- start:324 stop:545 length:222 start_codon:yes stop_codon:yes gene_type:complete